MCDGSVSSPDSSGELYGYAFCKEALKAVELDADEQESVRKTAQHGLSGHAGNPVLDDSMPGDSLLDLLEEAK